MGGEIPRAKLDDMMSELRERLRHVSEHAAKVRESANIPEPRHSGPLSSIAHADPHSHTQTEECPRHHIAVESDARLIPEMWPAHLRKLSSILELATHDCEKEFLFVGARLADFQQRACKISDISEHVVRIITDREIGRTITDLDRILFKIKGWLLSCPPDSIHPTRMKNAASVVDKTLECLDSLQKKQGMSAHMLGEFLDKSSGIARSIGSVVESMQYNDITRQHLEHTQSEVRSLSDRLTASKFGPTMSCEPGFAGLAAEAGAVSDAQARSLLAASEELGSAVSSIRDNLARIAMDAAGMAEEMHSVTSGDGDSGKSFLSAIGNWLGALTDTISSLRDENISGRGEVPEEFGRMVEELRGMVDGLHTINGNILYRLSILEESGKTLSSDIEEAAGGITMHHRVATASEDVAAGLKVVADEARRIAPNEMRQAASRLAIAAHQHAHGGAQGSRRDKDGPAFGDNIEMF